MTDERERRWIPWTREADEKAKYISTIAGLFLAIIGSSSGILRVDKFGYSDFVREIEIERLKTTAQIVVAIHNRREECQAVRHRIESRLDAIDQMDSSTAGGLKACRDNYTQLHYDVRELRKRINGME